MKKSHKILSTLGLFFLVALLVTLFISPQNKENSVTGKVSFTEWVSNFFSKEDKEKFEEDFWKISEEEVKEWEETYLYKESEITSFEDFSFDELSGDSFYSSGCGFDASTPQGPPIVTPDDPLPKEGGNLFPGDCFWRAIFRAKADMYGESFTYGDYLNALAVAESMGMTTGGSRGLAVGGTYSTGAGTSLPAPGTSPRDHRLSEFIIRYLDNYILSLGGGGGDYGDSIDNIILIGPGFFNFMNKANLYRLVVDEGATLILNFNCKGVPRGPIPPGSDPNPGHTVNTKPKDAGTPRPFDPNADCTETTFHIEGGTTDTVTVNRDGQVTRGTSMGACHPGQTEQLTSMIIISRTSP